MYHVARLKKMMQGNLLYFSVSVFQDTEEALIMNLRDSQVLNHKENLDWNWNLIGTILKVSLQRP